MFLLNLKIEAFSIIRKFRFSERGPVSITSDNRGSTVIAYLRTHPLYEVPLPAIYSGFGLPAWASFRSVGNIQFV